MVHLSFETKEVELILLRLNKDKCIKGVKIDYLLSLLFLISHVFAFL